jgi:hypothetical protein
MAQECDSNIQQLDEMCHKATMRDILFTWRLQAVKSIACSLVVRAVEDGNRKAQDLFRTLTSSPWICRNIVWDGYSQNPFTESTNSRVHWISSRTNEGGESSYEVLGEALEVPRPL